MGFTKIEKKYGLSSQFDAVKIQFLLYCFAKSIKLSDADYNCLTYFAIQGVNKESIDLILSLGIFKTKQVVMNCLTRYSKLNIIAKKTHEINPEIGITIDNFIGIEAKIVNINK